MSRPTHRLEISENQKSRFTDVERVYCRLLYGGVYDVVLAHAPVYEQSRRGVPKIMSLAFVLLKYT